MSATGLIALVSGGGIGVAAAILIALSLMRVRRRSNSAVGQNSDPEMADAMTQIQADIDRGRRAY